MHRISLAAGHELQVRCTACKNMVAVQSNKGKAPVQLAFNHPRQSIAAKCQSCNKDLTWEPQEAKQVLSGLTK